eukprot:290966_1
MDTGFDGRYGRENKMKPGKTFYKGREKQINRDKNPSQWSAYNKAPRIQHSINHHSPLECQLSKTRETGILSTKSLPSIVENNDNNNTKDVNQNYLDANETNKILKLSKQQMDDNKDNENEKNKNKKSKLKITKSEELFQLKSSNISLHDI